MKLLQNARFHFLILFGICLFLTFNRHSKHGPGDYRSTIFSDRAGYYIFLPSTFIYHSDASKMPNNIDSLQGNGYKVNLKTGKVISKYPTGSALLESPFFFAAHVVAISGLYAADGFSKIYEIGILLSTLFWVLLGLWLIFKILSIYVDFFVSITSIWVLVFATNLIHYTTTDAGSSHAFSFFAIAWLTYLLHFKKDTSRYFIFAGIAFGLCISTRYILAIPLLLFLPMLFSKTVLNLANFKKMILVISGLAIPLLPDLLYHLYIGNSGIYEGETFSNWLSPKISWVLFAPDNGWLLYNPIWLMLIPGIATIYRVSKQWFYTVLFSFLSLLILYSCWYDPTLGCGMGYRGFVDIYPLLAIPMGIAIKKLFDLKRLKFIAVVLILATAWNMKLFFDATTCFDSTNTNIWNWNLFFSFMV